MSTTFEKIGQVVLVLAVIVTCSSARAEVGPGLLTNPDFETVEITSTFIGEDGGWSGDDSAIVTAQNGIVPFSGSQMLHFIHSTPLPASASADSSQVFQTVDLTGFGDDIATGFAFASASFWANRILGDGFTDTGFGLEFLASDLAGTELATAFGPILESDGNVETWQQVVFDFPLPLGTTQLRVGVRAIENTVNDTIGAEFDGHYADDFSLTIGVVPEPTTLSLLAIGLIASVKRRNK